jgi:hypothetical protein
MRCAMVAAVFQVRRMRIRAFVFGGLLLVAASISGAAQITDASVCDILANPQSFDGKIVRLTGTVVGGFDEFAIKNGDCHQPVNAIWLAYPEGTKAKSGPAAVIFLQTAGNGGASSSAPARSAVALEKNKDFQQFDTQQSTPAKAASVCLGCTRYSVSATFVGRLDGSATAGVQRDAAGKVSAVTGFGNMNLYKARLVLQSVANVTSKEIDYSKAGKEESGHDSGGDPFAAGSAAAGAFQAGSQPAQLIRRAADAYGAQGEDNGVSVGFSGGNEVPQGEGEKGKTNSPDGVIYHCIFDQAQLKGGAFTVAIIHLGNHVADLRSVKAGETLPSLGTFEFAAWQTAALGAIGGKQKKLVLPGGFIAWDAAWPHADIPTLMAGGIRQYLATWAALGN